MKKIMFNDHYGLNQAVLDRRKMQTRRIITTNLYNRVDWKAFEEGNYDCVITDDASAAADIRDLAAYRVGEEVAVAQSYRDVCHEVFLFSTKVKGKEYRQGWENKMFVRADLMPHRIRITNVRVERLQDISDEDCLKEGIEMLANKNGYKVFALQTGSCYTTAKIAFSSLIDKTCCPNTWNSNPYVFVYDFELVK